VAKRKRALKIALNLTGVVEDLFADHVG
jgi:hypothetical protein